MYMRKWVMCIKTYVQNMQTYTHMSTHTHAHTHTPAHTHNFDYKKPQTARRLGASLLNEPYRR